MSEWGRCRCGAFLTAFDDHTPEGFVEGYYTKCRRPGCKYQLADDKAFARQWDGFTTFMEEETA